MATHSELSCAGRPIDGRDILFLDPGVEHGDLLAAGAHAGVETIRLNADEAPLRQIARHLGQRKGIGAVHVVTHGAPGRLAFAGGVVDLDTVTDQREDLLRIGAFLGENTAIHLWACDVASEPGHRFVTALAATTNATVAAASHCVGAAAEGGSWILDVAAGGCSANAAPFDGRAMATYPGVLASVSGTAGNDTLTGTTGIDVILGLGGDDLLSGLGGGDLLIGGPGHDTISGGAGADTLWSGEDANTLFGGADGDFFYGSAGDLNGDRLGDFTPGEDSIAILGVTTTDPARVTVDGDTWSIDTDGNGSPDVVLTIPGVSGTAVIGLTQVNFGQPTLVLAGGSGTAGNDSLLGLGGDNSIGGAAGNDLIHAGAGNDRVDGGSDNDTLYGGAGNDSLLGAAGDDVLIGGDDADLLYGGLGNDLLYGDDGNDTVLLLEGGNNTVYGGAGDDAVSAGGGNDLLIGGAGNDIIFDQGGNDTLSGGAGNDTLIALSGNNQLHGGLDHDRLIVGAGNDTLSGGVGNDTVTGAGGDDVLDGGEGVDQLYGGLGNDLLSGGAGTDTLSGGAGNDTVFGGDDVDIIFGGDGDDLLYGGIGNDLLSGGTGNDTLSGGAGNDTLSGGAGNDVLIGGAGADQLVLGAGSDRIDVQSSITELHGDTVVGFGEDDSIRAGGSTLTLVGQTRGAGSSTVTLSAGGDTITSTLTGDYRSGFFTLADNGRALVFDATAPTLSTSSPSDNATDVAPTANLVLNFSESVKAGTGSILIKRVSDDTVSHTISIADGSQITFSGAQLTVNPTVDLAYGTGYYLNIDKGVIQDEAGNNYAGLTDKTTLNFTTGQAPSTGGGDTSPPTDIIVVTPSTPGTNTGGTTPSGQPSSTETVTNTSSTQSGTAALVQNTGNSNLVTATLPPQVTLINEGSRSAATTTQAASDLVGSIQAKDPAGNMDVQTSVANNWINSRPAGTMLDIRTLTLSAPAGAPPSEPIVIAGTASGQGSSFQEAFVIDVTSLPSGTVINLKNIEFASIKGNVQVTGGDGSNFVIGDDSVQIIVLGEDDDTLMGGGGNDMVGSTGGNDVLYGNQGDDTVTGGADSDTLYGGQQADVVYGNTADDVLYGNLGNDTLYGGQNSDTLFGGRNADLLYGNLGDDRLYGGVEQDTLYGGQGNDLADGGDGADVLHGNAGDDTLRGGEGADTLRGGAGNDVLSGGSGGDVYQFGSGDGNDSIFGYSEADGDRLVYDSDTGVLSTTTSNGNTILTLQGGGTVTLMGYTPPTTGPVTPPPPVDDTDMQPQRLAEQPRTDDLFAYLSGGD